MNVSELTVSVVAENTAHGAGVLGEHGLSLWIETPARGVLFDTGQGLVLPHNSERMGIGLDGADAIVLSHGHYDHTGGLGYALRQAPKARLFLHPAALAPRYSRRDGQAREIGMPPHVREALQEHGPSVTWTRAPTEVAPGLFVTGPVPRRNDFEDTGGSFYLDAEGCLPDPIEDDQSLWIELPAGVVVVLGCAHSGVVNTLDFIREQTGGKTILAVVGGMHLGAASEERVTRTIDAFRRLAVKVLRPCHCTGPSAAARLMSAFGDRCRPCAAGARLEF